MNITAFPHHNQLFLDLNIAIPFEVDEHEAALILLLQSLDYSQFNREKKKSGRPPAVDPYTMLLILIYARTQGKYSSREVERLCKRDLFLLHVLQGKKAPDHSTFDRFVHTHETAIDELFFQAVNRLDQLGELTKDVVYQDGSKIESKANRYTFVWKKAVKVNQKKLKAHIQALIDEVNSRYCWNIASDDLEQALEEIQQRIKDSGKSLIPETMGKGHHMSVAQRIYRNAGTYHEKLLRYREYMSQMDGRNSMSKTDVDATFMHMKEDHMRNGQLKPAYNLQVLVDGGYVVGSYASADRTDYATMIPALDHMHSHINWQYREVCADSGYDSQQNFEALEARGITAYIKPQRYDLVKKRSFRKDIGRRENMAYDERSDYFTCAAGKKLVLKYVRKRTYQNGYTTHSHVYHCKRGCRSCTLRKSCMKNSRAKYKHVEVNQQVAMYHRQVRALLTSEHGKEIRVNRSIQAEGVFAQIKANWSFRRFLRSGMSGVYTEWLLVCLAMNVQHLGNRLVQGSVGDPFNYRLIDDSA